MRDVGALAAERLFYRRWRPTWLHTAGLNVGLAAVYLAAAKLGLSLAIVNPSATAVWPPTGIALAAVLVFGRRVWPGIALGAFVANATTAGSLVTSAGSPRGTRSRRWPGPGC